MLAEETLGQKSVFAPRQVAEFNAPDTLPNFVWLEPESGVKTPISGLEWFQPVKLCEDVSSQVS